MRQRYIGTTRGSIQAPGKLALYGSGARGIHYPGHFSRDQLGLVAGQDGGATRLQRDKQELNH